MNTEGKQLLLKDLCARLPYGVVIKDTYSGHYGRLVEIGNVFVFFISKLNCNTLDVQLCHVKPYLRPMSSMTEEEKEEASEAIEIELKALEGPDGFTVENAASSAFMIDFYNKHHLDYRGLIPMGLALEAKEGMYK